MYKITPLVGVRLIRDKLVSLLCFPEARLIRWPFYFRFNKSRPRFPKLTTGVGSRFDVFENGKLILGSGIEFNDYCHIACMHSISIGDDCLIASKVFITDHNHSFGRIDIPIKLQGIVTEPVIIGKNCWIGENVSILKGSQIGDNCIIGANSVVNRSFAGNSIIAGVPARVIRSRDDADAC
jgi:lipopolysaccharide O-acetyltransferase